MAHQALGWLADALGWLAEVAKPEEAAAGLSEVPMILAAFLGKLSPKGKGVWQERWFAPGLALSQCSSV